jgi:hypothetical protein
LVHHERILKLGRLAQIEFSLPGQNIEKSALWPTQLGSTLGQGYEIKSEVLLGNIWGKHWEFVVNPLGTQENNM